MSLTSGTKLGPYEIQSPLGAGGMGEVYRARDTRLDRNVAIKVLPTHLSSNIEAKQRFDREARSISSLNHPNICTLYDVGHQNGIDYLVMELLEGETLSQRLTKGPLPTELVLKYGIDICDGLDKAHKNGVVHRDLKPGNVMLTKSGAKLLDFGLAKPPSSLTPASGALTAAATMTSPASPITQHGSLVGTFQYMSPEQVEGRDADSRSDIFALGAVLYEMTTGKRAFQGKSTLSVASAILEKDPDPISALQPLTPPALEHTIRTCLEKDPEERFQTAHDVKLQLKWIGLGGSQAGVAKPIAARRRKREWMAWAMAGVLSLIMLAAGWMLHRPPAAPVLRSALVLPPKLRLDTINSSVALSPDGKRVVIAASGADGKQQLYLRSLDALAVQPMAGTEEATYPFWSPDGEYIGFLTPGKLKKVTVASGAIQTVCDAVDGRGGTWNKDGTIVFAPAGDSGLYAVPDSGGTPVQITSPEKAGRSHRHPQFLPDGKHVLYFAGEPGKAEGLFVVDVDSKKSEFIVEASSAGRYVEPGYLLYVKEHSLLAQPFSPRSLKVSGRAIPIAQQVQYGGLRWVSNFASSNNGLLLYQGQEGGGQWQLFWVGLDGKDLGKLGEPRVQSSDTLSPDGKRALVVVQDQNESRASLWMYDVGRGVASRFTFDAGRADDPVWSPDGREVAYSVSSPDGWKIYAKAADGTGSPKELLSVGDTVHPGNWSPDGKFLSYDTVNPKSKKFEVWMLPLSGEQKPYSFLRGENHFRTGNFSADGRWFVYQSNETGRAEVYVIPFPGPGEKRQVSLQGGIFPGWFGRHGIADEGVFYYDPVSNKVMLVPVTEKTDSLEFGQAKALFGDRNFVEANGASFSPDWKRLLVSLPTGNETSGSLQMVSNWPAELQK